VSRTFSAKSKDLSHSPLKNPCSGASGYSSNNDVVYDSGNLTSTKETRRNPKLPIYQHLKHHSSSMSLDLLNTWSKSHDEITTLLSN